MLTTRIPASTSTAPTTKDTSALLMQHQYPGADPEQGCHEREHRQVGGLVTPRRSQNQARRAGEGHHDALEEQGSPTPSRHRHVVRLTREERHRHQQCEGAHQLVEQRLGGPSVGERRDTDDHRGGAPRERREQASVSPHSIRGLTPPRDPAAAKGHDDASERHPMPTHCKRRSLRARASEGPAR